MHSAGNDLGILQKKYPPENWVNPGGKPKGGKRRKIAKANF